MPDMHEVNAVITNSKARVAELMSSLKIDEKRAALADIDKKMAASDFWNDSEAAQEIVQSRKGFTVILEPFDAFISVV